jgi:aspartate-semialdehyde dehydrogenase
MASVHSDIWPTVGVIGARGVVGGVFLSILHDAGLPRACLRAFGREDRNTVAYGSESVDVRVLTDDAAAELDVLFVAVGADESRAVMDGPGRRIPLVVDNSSAFRLADGVPLVVPEANAHAARERRGNLIANANCTTAAAVVVLAPIRDVAGLESVDLASYQAVSGAGRAGIDAWRAERGSEGQDQAAGSPFHGRIADSVVPQVDQLDDSGWTGEERKIHAEIRKILEMPYLDVAAIAV